MSFITKNFDIVGGARAAKEQRRGFRDALRNVAEYQAGLRDYLDALQERGSIYAQTGIERARAGAKAFPGLVEAATNPTMTEGYRLAVREGLNQLQQNFATRGAPDSSAAALAAGRFLEGVTARERDRQLETQFKLAELARQAGPTGLGYYNTGAGLYGPLGQSYGLMSDLFVGKTAANAAQIRQLWHLSGQNTETAVKMAAGAGMGAAGVGGGAGGGAGALQGMMAGMG